MKLWRAETGIFVGVWLYLLWIGQAQFLLDPGPFWSTVLGQRIIATGQVPQAEEFSCTLRGQSWNSHQWLAQVIMAGLHAIGELDSLVLAAATLLAGLYTWVAYRLVRVGLHWSVAVLLVALTIMASRYHLIARPHLASIVFMGGIFARLVDFEAGTVTRRGLFWLPPAFVVWTNLHGGALGGLATVSLVVAGWLIARIIGVASPVSNRRDALVLVLLLAGCGLATLINPYGWQLPRAWGQLMTSPVVPKYMVEHMRLDPWHPYQATVLVFGLIYILALLNLPSWKALQVSWLLPIVWLLLTMQRIRHCDLFSITAVVALGAVLPHTRAAAWLAEQGSWLYTPPKEQKGAPAAVAWAFLVPALAVLAAFGLQATGRPVPLLGKDVAESVREWPIALLPQLRDYADRRPGAAVFNDMAYGGFLIYYTPQLRPFIDDRCELYGDQVLQDYFETNTAWRDSSPEDIARRDDFIARWEHRYGIHLELALVMKRSGFHYFLEGDPDRWVKIGETSTDELGHGAVLYQRRPATR